jgi:hypothetical protein
MTDSIFLGGVKNVFADFFENGRMRQAQSGTQFARSGIPFNCPGQGGTFRLQLLGTDLMGHEIDGHHLKDLGDSPQVFDDASPDLRWQSCGFNLCGVELYLHRDKIHTAIGQDPGYI